MYYFNSCTCIYDVFLHVHSHSAGIFLALQQINDTCLVIPIAIHSVNSPDID